jgi:UrcA family protein
MHTILRKRLYTGLSCLLGTLAASGAMSSSARALEETPISKVVRFGDLDITKPAGAQALYRRIQAAAQQVCALPMSRTLVTAELERTCTRTAVDGAVRQVNSEQLTALRFGRPVLMARK